jgi:hypothetical protein
MGRSKVDTLSKRISARKPLTEGEIDTLAKMIGHGCWEQTKRSIRIALAAVPHIRNYGIFDRVHLKPTISYCAGQSYPDEIRTVKECLI